MGSADRSGPCPETQRPDSAALSTVGAEQPHVDHRGHVRHVLNSESGRQLVAPQAAT